jgi:hypothetical protein
MVLSKTVIPVNWAMNGGVTYATPFGVSITRIKPSSLFSVISSNFPSTPPSVLDISTGCIVAELVPFVKMFRPKIKKAVAETWLQYLKKATTPPSQT